MAKPDSADQQARRAAARDARVFAVAETQRKRLIADVKQMSEDAGVTQRALAEAAGISRSHLNRILDGTTKPSFDTCARLGDALGADFVARLYVNSGSPIRDRHQARILEALLERRYPRWQPFTEVIVRQPVRGAIDLALFEPRERLIVATEIQSELRRIEQVVRWSREKADALPSWSGWSAAGDPRSGEPPVISQLLVVRATRATRRVAAEFARQLSVAFPAHPHDALAALTGTAAWPGSAMVWAEIGKSGVRFLPTR
ncbi:MAG: helix-turn-helix transcriptional regulator [Candidatus Limnocylindrales bacterium]